MIREVADRPEKSLVNALREPAQAGCDRRDVNVSRL